MHRCLKCGKEFKSNFCPQCGTKWVDPDVCPNCGAHHEPDELFCQECGARLDGKLNCPNCGAWADSEDTFCGECGAILNGRAATADVTVNSVDKKDKVKSYLALFGTICILLSALIGLIFIFFTGLTETDLFFGEEIKETRLLYYFFKDAYKDLDSLRDFAKLQNDGEISVALDFGLGIPIVIGTTVCVVGLLGAVISSIITACGVYKKYCKKQDVNVVAPAAVTYFMFVAVSVTLAAIMGTRESSYTITLSSTTLAGLITGGILLESGIVLLAVSNSLKGFNARAVITTAVVCVLTVVVLALTALPAVDYKIIDFNDNDTVHGKISLLLIMMSAARQFDEKVNEIVAFGTLGGIAGIVLATICVAALIKYLSALCKGESVGLSFGTTMVVCSVIYLVFIVLFNHSAFGDYDTKQLSVSFSYAVPVSILILSVLSFIVGIIGKRINNVQE